MKGRAIIYEPEKRTWVEANCTMPRAEAHALFCARFLRPDVRLVNFNSLCKRKGWMTGRTGCFHKGQIFTTRARRTGARRAAKRGTSAGGARPHTWRGAGHERIDSKDGYVVMIVAETNPWTGAATRPVLKHRYLWEQTHGPVPAGHVLKCLDGNKTNTDPSNWELVPQALLPRLAGAKTGIHYDSAAPELKPAIMATAKLQHAARGKKERCVMGKHTHVQPSAMPDRVNLEPRIIAYAGSAPSMCRRFMTAWRNARLRRTAA